MRNTVLKLMVAALLSVVCAGEASAQFCQMKIKDYGIQAIYPTGPGSIGAVVWLHVENPEVGFSVERLTGTIFCEGQSIMEGKTREFYVPEGTSTVIVTATADLLSGFTLLSALKLLSFDPDDYTVSIKTDLKYDEEYYYDETRRRNLYNLPVKYLLQREPVSTTIMKRY